ncbi:choice-of-anchor B family protein [Pontibacter sp. G13]|uniref:choice-of-anchor B family protein n=1 Tax=Pontibacter sp. G13 TaxID=3074898 RepID=UPI00288B38F8|nr:choice-of-anchor B family protein [Pontibacter sp. G13]WNJ17730.1 choice-of-anchor B family protein [Pontibacter sp. G13]
MNAKLTFQLGLLLPCLLLFFGSALHAQTAFQVDLLGQLSYSQGLNDVWGYVDGQGREYALVGTHTGTSIVDVSDPLQPLEVVFVDGPQSIWRDIKTRGEFAYVTNETDSGLQVIDLTQLPVKVESRYVQAADMKSAHNLYIEGDRLYLVGGNKYGGGIAVLDLAVDPWEPTFLFAYSSQYVHDVYVRDGIAYAAEVYRGKMRIIDLNGTEANDLGSVEYPGAFTHNTWLNDAGTVCFTTDELAAAKIHAWEVSDPGDIQYLDDIQSSLGKGLSIPHNVHVLDDYLITSYYADGLQVVDASRPHNLIEVGYYDTTPIEGGTYDGAWGAYPFLPSGNILVTDIDEGLFVMSGQYQRACYLEGKVSDAVSGNALSGARITLTENDATSLSNLVGEYATGAATAGTFTVVVSRFGYESKTETVELMNGEVADLTFELTPIEQTSISFKVIDVTTREAISNAQVLADFGVEGGQFLWETDAEGLVSSKTLPRLPMQVTAGKWGHLAHQVSVDLATASGLIQIELLEQYADDFVLDLGWSTSRKASRGAWERAIPLPTRHYLLDPTPLNPGQDLPDDLGEYCYVTGNDPYTPFTDDVDNGSVWLKTPMMDLSEYLKPYASWHYRLVNWSTSGGGQPHIGSMAVYQLIDGDTTELARFEGPLDTTWTRIAIPLHDPLELNGPAEIQLLFEANDPTGNSQHYVEAAMDGFEVKSSIVVDPNGNPQLYGLVQGEDYFIRYLLPEIWACEEVDFALYDLAGRELFQMDLAECAGELRLPRPLPTGVYVAVLERFGEVAFTTKLSVQ